MPGKADIKTYCNIATTLPAGTNIDGYDGRPGNRAERPTHYYLVGSILLFAEDAVKYDLADFVLRRGRLASAASVTPENRLAFLYDRTVYDGHTNKIVKEVGGQ